MTKRTVLITGGGRGIGAATAKALARHGHKILINYVRNEAAANDVLKGITDNGGEAFAYRADVTSQKETLEMFNRIQQEHGGVDILVSNANMNFEMKPFTDMTWEEFSQKLNDELHAAFNTAKLAVPAMMNKKFGRLIFISSTLSEHPSPTFIAHGTAKGALDSFSKYLAQELGPMGITSNIIAPGLVNTDATSFMPMKEKNEVKSVTPMRRIATPEDVANVAAFLAGDESSFVTGTYIPVSGGAYMK